MKSIQNGLSLGLILSFVLLAAACIPEAWASGSSGPANTPLTRAQVVKIVRTEVKKEFALRDWHHYSGYIKEYRGADSDALFKLTNLDRGTAIGNQNTSVRVILYSDYECPYCKKYELRIAPELHREFLSRVQFVFRFYPLSFHGENSKSEAIAGACMAHIAGPSAFRPFTSQVFAMTRSNGKGTAAPLALLARRAMNKSRADDLPEHPDKAFRKCTQGKTGAALIAPSSGFKGVTGTPAVFVVDLSHHRAWRVAGALPPWVFSGLIQNVLAGKPGNSDWVIKQGKVTPRS